MNAINPFAHIDFTDIPVPDVLAEIDFEDLLTERKEELLNLCPEHADELAQTLDLEGEPLNILLQESTYREMVLRQFINDVIHSLLLAQAQGSTLDNLAANRSVERLPGETDDQLRDRTQQAFWMVATAGPGAHYKAIAKAVDASIVDVSIVRLYEGNVTLTVLAPQEVPEDEASEEEKEYGKALFPDVVAVQDHVVIIARSDSPILNAVRAKVVQDDVQGFTDMVEVRSPTIKPFDISARLTLYPGPDANVVLAKSLLDVEEWLESIRKMGYDATEALALDAIVTTGVQDVALDWAGDVVCSELELAVCTGVYLTVEDERDV